VIGVNDMVRTALLFSIGIIALFLATLSCGCTTPMPEVYGPVTPGPATEPVIATPTQAGEPPKVSFEGDDAVLAGSGNGTVNASFSEGSYKVTFRHPGGFALKRQTSVGWIDIVPGNQYPDSAGRIQFSTIMAFSGGQQVTFDVTSAGPYEISFRKLPLTAAADTTPKMYTGTGMSVQGPISLKNGHATITIRCPDVQNETFTVELYNAGTGGKIDTLATGLSDSFSQTRSYDVPGAGEYLIKVTANGKSGWDISVAQ
jgi:hypothetical protein